MAKKPLCIDLFCGLGGWTEGFLAEGYDVIGFDIERRPYPAQLVLQDVLTLHGSQFRNAACIVASPPCQEFSYRAMPWKIAKAQKPEVLPDWWKLTEQQMSPAQLREWEIWKGEHPLPPPDMRLFKACFRLQHEAFEETGRRIPLVVENVRGIQPHAGPPNAKFGSFYLYGDVGMVGSRVVAGFPRFGHTVKPFKARKNDGGSWFNIAHNTESGVGKNPVHELAGQKVPGFRFDGSGRSFQSASVEATGIKGTNGIPNGDKPEGAGATSWFHGTRAGPRDVRRDADGDWALPDGTKIGGDWLSDPKSSCRKHGSRSAARKMASAKIAMIPLPLARYIARAFKPEGF